MDGSTTLVDLKSLVH